MPIERVGHVALVADSLETVTAIYQRLKEHNVPIVRTRDHGYTKRVYCQDPEGNEIEIYCEVPETPWQKLDTVIRGDEMDFEQAAGG